MSHLTYGPETGLSLGELEPTPTSYTQTEIIQQPQEQEHNLDTQGAVILGLGGLVCAIILVSAKYLEYKHRYGWGQPKSESIQETPDLRVVEDQ